MIERRSDVMTARLQHLSDLESDTTNRGDELLTNTIHDQDYSIKCHTPQALEVSFSPPRLLSRNICLRTLDSL